MLLPQNDPLDDELDAPPAPDEDDDVLVLVLDEDDVLAPDEDDVLAPDDDVLAPEEEDAAPPVPLLDPPVPKRSVSPTPPHAKAVTNRVGGASRIASARSCMTRLQGDRRGSSR